jgi:hypothetical protein
VIIQFVHVRSENNNNIYIYTLQRGYKTEYQGIKLGKNVLAERVWI